MSCTLLTPTDGRIRQCTFRCMGAAASLRKRRDRFVEVLMAASLNAPVDFLGIADDGAAGTSGVDLSMPASFIASVLASAMWPHSGSEEPAYLA